eukprot:g409.t1
MTVGAASSSPYCIKVNLCGNGYLSDVTSLIQFQLSTKTSKASESAGTRSRRLAEFEANHAMQTSSSSPISRSIANFQSLGAVPISMLAVSHFVVHVGIVAEGLELVQY